MSFFEKKIATLLHDPPNKAWNIKSHREISRQLTKDIFGTEGDNMAKLLEDPDVLNADRVASAIDRWVLTKAMAGKYEHGKWPTSKVSLYNPFSVQEIFKVDLEGSPDIRNFTKKMFSELEEAKKRLDQRQLYHLFYSIYEYEWLDSNSNSPADTRIPIHTIFDHNYASVTALNLIKERKVKGWLVHIDIGNIQNFIRNSKKLVHFWSSSWLVSAISWHLISPFVMEFGPDILILPTARSNPFYYCELMAELSSIATGAGSSNRSSAKLLYKLDKLQAVAKDLAGYDAKKGFPSNAVMPATITLVLPSKELYYKEVQDFESKCNTNIEDKEEITNFIFSRFKNAWSSIVEQVMRDLRGSEAERLFTDLGIGRVPPLTLRTAIAKIDEKVNGANLSDIYDQATKKIAHEIEPLRQVKVSPYVQLNLTEFTKKHDHFRICTLCGQLPGLLKNSLPSDLARYLDDTDRLCPYCMTKHLMTSSTEIFRSIVKKLLHITWSIERPRFPSLATISSFPFTEKLVNIGNKDPSLIPPPLPHSVVNIHEDTLYKSENQLINKFKKKLEDTSEAHEDTIKILAFLFDEPEKTIYGNKENRKLWKSKGVNFNPNTYYALLKGDGDDVGEIILGNLSKVNIFGSTGFKISEHFARLTPNIELAKTLKQRLSSQDQKLPASITFHATISRALMTFSINAVEIIERNKGFVLYAGGDDVICILPAENALNAAFEIRSAYRGTQELEGFYNIKSHSSASAAFILSMGGLGQTFSLVYSHYKYPLSYAIDKLNNEEKNTKEQEWNSISKNNIAITYLARSSHDATVYLPLQREGLKLGSICKEIDDLLRDIHQGRYSESILSDFLNWKEKIRYIEYEDDNENIILQLIKYIISRNTITTNQKPDYEKLADRISRLAKIKNNRRKVGDAAIRERDKLKNKSLIEDFFVALKVSNSARREIE